MHKRDRKRYSREFKLEAVRWTQITGKSVAEVARELELPVHHLYKWHAEVDRYMEDDISSLHSNNLFPKTKVFRPQKSGFSW